MKEAAGEANMTVVTIILIGVVVAVATPIINNMMSNTEKKACCMNNGGIFKNGHCYKVSDTGAESQDDSLLNCSY